jgi:hypothetical protein
LILGIALVLAGFLAGGRYSITLIDKGVGQAGTLSRYLVYEVDRFTGVITACYIADETGYRCLQSERTIVKPRPTPEPSTP